MRPHLNQVEWNGSTANNIIANAPTGTPFEDPQAPPEERFKAIGQVGGSFDAATGDRLDPQKAYEQQGLYRIDRLRDAGAIPRISSLSTDGPSTGP